MAEDLQVVITEAPPLVVEVEEAGETVFIDVSPPPTIQVLPVTSVEVEITEGPDLTVTVERNPDLTVEVNPTGTVGPRGLQGDPGPTGPPSTWDDLSGKPVSFLPTSYTHTQNSASDTWVIDHYLGRKPSVSARDNAGNEVEGSVHHPNTNQSIISYSVPFSGEAYLI